jgi:hypothetical protein
MRDPFLKEKIKKYFSFYTETGFGDKITNALFKAANSDDMIFYI